MLITYIKQTNYVEVSIELTVNELSSLDSTDSTDLNSTEPGRKILDMISEITEVNITK